MSDFRCTTSVLLVAATCLLGVGAGSAVVRAGNGAAAPDGVGPPTAPLTASTTTIAPLPTTVPPVPPPTAVLPPPTTSTTATTVAPTAASVDVSAGWEQRRGEAVLATLRYPWQSLGYTFAFLPARGDYRGRGFHDERRIEIYVRPGDDTAALAHVIAHEIGHAVDYLHMTPEREAVYRAVRGISLSLSWSPCGFCTDFGFVSGDFAESFAWWLLGSTDFKSTVAPPPSAAQLLALEPLFRL